MSRRGLFGAGARRLLEERLGAHDHPPSAPAAPVRVPDWGAGCAEPLFARLAPAATHLVTATGIGTGHRVLDVAAGDGNLALAAARAGASVVAGDASPVLVERGRGRTARAGVEVEWGVADAEALPYADESFDCVVSNFGVIHAYDARRAMAELERVVRPGGVVALTAWSPTGALGRLLREAAGADPSRADRWGRYETARLRFTGLEDFEMLDCTLTMEFAGEDELWSVFANPPGPLAGLLDAGEDPEDVRCRLLRAVAPDRRAGASGVTLDVTYSLVRGHKDGCATTWRLPGRE